MLIPILLFFAIILTIASIILPNDMKEELVTKEIVFDICICGCEDTALCNGKIVCANCGKEIEIKEVK